MFSFIGFVLKIFGIAFIALIWFGDELFPDEDSSKVDSKEEIVKEETVKEDKPMTKRESNLIYANAALKNSKSDARTQCSLEVKRYVEQKTGLKVKNDWNVYTPVMDDKVASDSTFEVPHFIWEVRFLDESFEVAKTGEKFSAACDFDPMTSKSTVTKINGKKI